MNKFSNILPNHKNQNKKKLKLYHSIKFGYFINIKLNELHFAQSLKVRSYFGP